MLHLHRQGRSNGVIALGLFMLSCLLMIPALRWSFESDAPPVTQNYVLSPPDGSSDAIQQAAHASAAGATDTQLKIRAWHYVSDLAVEIAQFETVFWEPDDTESLREYLANSKNLPEARVLEIGTGTGLVALCCAVHQASHVVATDINPAAVANAAYNAEHLGLGELMECRLVPRNEPAPFSVIAANEQFDFIISNPPWEDLDVEQVAAHALYDPGFALLDGMLKDAPKHLTAEGKLMLAYGAKQAIQRIMDTAPSLGWQVHIADERSLAELTEVFLPGMLLVLTKDNDSASIDP